MSKIFIKISFLPFLLIIGILGCSKKTMLVSNMPTINAYAPINPILKRLDANPQLRLLVNTPRGYENTTYNKLKLTVNADALSNIEKIDVYMPGTESFAAQNRIASVIPTQTNLEITINQTLPVGYSFIWISTVLKDNANINTPIEIHCTGLVSTTGKNIVPTDGNYGYKKLSGIAIRKANEDNVHTYRIPGIIKTNTGALIAVYDARYTSTVDLPGNIDVGMSRSTDGGNSWEPMKIIMDMGAPHANNGVGDPSILFDPVTSKIIVAALWSKGNRSIAGSLPGLSPDTTGQFVLASSSNDGLSWTAPYTITPQVKNPAWHIFFNGPGNGIAMDNGTLVFAAQYWDEVKVPYATIIYSNDHGSSWIGKIAGPKSNTTESQVVETSPGNLMLNMRDNRGRFRSVATTSNLGQSWTEHPTSYSALPDPVCQASIIKAKVNVGGILKDVLFFSNPNSATSRHNITIKASLDMGNTWLPQNQFLVDSRNCFGYSSLVQIDENTIGILYEGNRDLYFVRVPVENIIH